MGNILKYAQKLLIIIFLPPLIYSILVIIGWLIPVNIDSNPQKGYIAIYLVQNGSHTDLVVPIQNEVINWKNIIRAEHFPSSNLNARYYSFGWGDREFYRETPHWEDLELEIAFRALFLNTTSAIHIKQLEKIEAEKSIEIKLDSVQYRRLSEYFLKHLEFTSNGKLAPLNFNYSKNDVFYDSKSSFHAFRTCNSWINNALKYSGSKACFWTPFAWPLFWHYS